MDEKSVGCTTEKRLRYAKYLALLQINVENDIIRRNIQLLYIVNLKRRDYII